MEKKEKNESTHSSSRYASSRESLELDSIFRDILRQWWVILLAAATAALICSTYLQFTYVPTYTTKAIFVVSKGGINSNTTSSSLTAASTLASNFSTVVESDILDTRICRELGISEVDWEVSVDVVESTSLMTMTVNAGSPRLAYEVILAAMDVGCALSEELTSSVVLTVLSEPTIPSSPSNSLSVRRPMMEAAGIALAVMVLLFAVLSYFKKTVKNEEGFKRKVDARLLATLSHERKNKTIFDLPKQKKYSMFMENPSLSFGYVEGCRLMGTRIRRELDKKEAKVLLVTSVSENEGKSTVAVNLAMSLVQEGHRAVLLDCDFRRPSQYRILRMGKELSECHDLGESLKKKEWPVFLDMGVEKNLSVAFSIKVHRHLLSQGGMDTLEKILLELRQQVDYVIMDTSPLGLVAEGTRLASLADASLLVVEQDRIEAPFINDTIDRLNDTRAKVLGCVFNNVRTGLVNRLSTYGAYGYGRGYGRYGYGKYGYGRYGYGASARSAGKE